MFDSFAKNVSFSACAHTKFNESFSDDKVGKSRIWCPWEKDKSKWVRNQAWFFRPFQVCLMKTDMYVFYLKFRIFHRITLSHVSNVFQHSNIIKHVLFIWAREKKTFYSTSHKVIEINLIQRHVVRLLVWLLCSVLLLSLYVRKITHKVQKRLFSTDYNG